jgi:hypothetical protein
MMCAPQRGRAGQRTERPLPCSAERAVHEAPYAQASWGIHSPSRLATEGRHGPTAAQCARREETPAAMVVATLDVVRCTAGRQCSVSRRQRPRSAEGVHVSGATPWPAIGDHGFSDLSQPGHGAKTSCVAAAADAVPWVVATAVAVGFLAGLTCAGLGAASTFKDEPRPGPGQLQFRDSDRTAR